MKMPCGRIRIYPHVASPAPDNEYRLHEQAVFFSSRLCTCSASSRCFEARRCASTLPCNAEEAEDATLRRAKDEFFDFFLRLHHKGHRLSILELFSVSLLKIQILTVKT